MSDPQAEVLILRLQCCAHAAGRRDQDRAAISAALQGKRQSPKLLSGLRSSTAGQTVQVRWLVCPAH